jgi:hypothetical protein
LAFGRSCRVIADRVHAEKENMEGHRSKRQARSLSLQFGHMAALHPEHALVR